MSGTWFWRGILAASGLVIIGCAVILGIRYYQARSATKIVPLAETGFFHYDCKGDAESLPCLQLRYQQLTQTKGVTAAFSELKAAYQTDSSIRANCHQLTHVIGRTEAEKASTVSEAFSQGDQFCWAGYYHGVMETFLAWIGTKDLAAKLPTVCAQIKAQKPYSFYHYNCVHGLGHGLMAVEDNNLFKSLDLCGLAGNEWEQESCQGGVFMQNVMASEDPNNHTDYLKPNQPMYPCTAVADNYKTQCYLMQTSYALTQASENFSVVFGECSSAGTYQDICYQGLGRDASGNSVSNVSQTTASCMTGPNSQAQSNCIIGAVKDFVSYFHSDAQAENLCQAQIATIQPICESTKTSYYATL